MRIFATSDLHVGHSSGGDALVAELATHVVSEGADVLLLGGDLGEGREHLERCLAMFDGFPGLILAVPGNHDVWLRGWSPEPLDSLALYRELLPDVFDAHGVHPLHLEPARLGDVGFVGSMGWYDYSFRDDIGIGLEHYVSKQPPWADRPVWLDARFARFPMGDPELTLSLADNLAEQRRQLVDVPVVIGLVHHLVSKQLLVHPRERVPTKWRYTNAFLGANALGDALLGPGQPATVLCGHIHLPTEATVGESMHVRCVGSGYRAKELLELDGNGAIVDRRYFGTPSPLG